MSGEGEEDMRLVDPGHTPGPGAPPDEGEENQGETTQAAETNAEPEPEADPAPSEPAEAAEVPPPQPEPAPLAAPEVSAASPAQSRMAAKSAAQSTGGPSTVGILKQDQMALLIPTQMKLPVSNVKRIVERVGRPTEASGHKQGRWYRDRNYVDVKTYNWDNMNLFLDYHRQMWTPDGSIKATCKK